MAHVPRRIGIIGLGQMGTALAGRLLSCGHTVFGLRKSESGRLRADALHGMVWCDLPRELASHCDVVLTCLPHSRHVAEVIEGESGLLPYARPGFIHIDHSTGTPAETARLASLYATRQAHLVDAAMLRTPQAAALGQLTLLTGGSPAVLHSLAPLFADYSVAQLHIGEVGAGQRLKLIVSLCGLGAAAVFAEAFAACRDCDIDPSLLHAAVSGSGVDSPTFQSLAAEAGVFAATGSVRQFALGHACKDLAALMSAAADAGVTRSRPAAMPMLCAASDALARALTRHGPDAPVSRLARA